MCSVLAKWPCSRHGEDAPASHASALPVGISCRIKAVGRVGGQPFHLRPPAPLWPKFVFMQLTMCSSRRWNYLFNGLHALSKQKLFCLPENALRLIVVLIFFSSQPQNLPPWCGLPLENNHILIVWLLIICKSGSGSISKNVSLTPKRNVHFYLRKKKEKKKSWQKSQELPDGEGCATWIISFSLSSYWCLKSNMFHLSTLNNEWRLFYCKGNKFHIG